MSQNEDEIRLHYSGYVIFAAQLLSVITGLIYTLLLTRNMGSKFGVWSNIFDLGAYFTVVVGLFPFWATRFVARKKEGSIKTGLIANFVLALVAVGLYIPVVFPATAAFHSQAYVVIYLIAAVQILNLYMINILESCLRAVKPQAIGHGLLIEEVVKVSLALVLIVGFKQLFIGAIISLIAGSTVQIAYYLSLVADDLRERVRWNYLGQWLKGSTAVIYNAVGGVLLSYILILLFTTPVVGQDARADYAAALVFATVIGYASYLSFALYPKLLGRNCPESDVTQSFKTVLMFTIPLSVLTLTMPQSLLAILNGVYAPAAPILQLLTLNTIIIIISQFYSNLIFGSEHLDSEGEISLRKLVRSKIFKVFSLPYIQAAIALPTAYFVLTHWASSSPVQAGLYVAIISIFVQLTSFIGLYATMHKTARLIVSWGSLGKYLVAGAAAAAVILWLPSPSTLTLTLAKALLGLAIYFAVLLATDADARKLISLVIEEIRSTLGRNNKTL